MSDDMFENVPPEKPAAPKPDPKPDLNPVLPVVFTAPAPPPAAPPPATPAHPEPELRAEPKPAAPPKAPRQQRVPKEREKSSFLPRVFKFSGVAALSLFVFSLIWALAYRFVPIPGTFLMIERAVQGYNVRRSPVALTKISPHLVRAVIAAEDSKFCKHSGFDFDAMNMAFEAAEAGKKLRGASTISQQTSKNVFLWQGRGFIRKGLEAYFTLLIETSWPKHRIMEAYLNSIEFGNGYFGAEAAARGYFGKSASKLSPREAASLAAILPSPNKWRAVNPGRYVAKRIGIVQRRMSIVRRDGLDDCVYDRSAKKK
ncbi:MAG: monofunctional biosynthetic peptidoglycan transglycosylase [Caulobacterales bacterium]